MARAKPLRVMEYLNDSGSTPIGWALLTVAEHTKWKKRPQSKRDYATGYFVIGGMEQYSEMGMIQCARLWDYFHTIKALPKERLSCAALEKLFESAADHPTNVAQAEDDDEAPSDALPPKP